MKCATKEQVVTFYIRLFSIEIFLIEFLNEKLTFSKIERRTIFGLL